MDGLSSLVAGSQCEFCRNVGTERCRALPTVPRGLGMCGWDRAGALKLHNRSSGMIFSVITKNFLHGDCIVRSYGAAVHDNWMLWACPI